MYQRGDHYKYPFPFLQLFFIAQDTHRMTYIFEIYIIFTIFLYETKRIPNIMKFNNDIESTLLLPLLFLHS